MPDTRALLGNVKSDSLVQLTEEEKNRLKELLLEIAEDIFAYCRAHGLRVMLGGGSVLGAVRHGGFIPWDDDLDLNMAREDYLSFAAHFEEEYGHKYELFVPDGRHHATHLFMKVSRKGTLMEDIYTAGSKYKTGVAIDIFPIEEVPAGKAVRRIRGFFSDVFAFSAVSCYLFQNRNPLAKRVYGSSPKARINYRIRLVLGALMSFRDYEWWYRNFDRFSTCESDSNLCTVPTGRKHYMGELREKSVFYPLREAGFENTSFLIPAMSDVYLTQLYGDYMKIPPVEKQEKHYYTTVKLS